MCFPLFMFFIVLSHFKSTAVELVPVHLTNNGPVVRGANLTFTASVDKFSGKELKFKYEDSVKHVHEVIVVSNVSKFVSQWIIQYQQHKYHPGEYAVSVAVMRKWYDDYWYPIGTARTKFQLTEKLNGNLTLKQDEVTRANNFVAVNETVSHIITLPANEQQFLKDNSSSLVAYWFIDCIYVYKTTDLVFNYTYQDLMGDHYLDVLVIANNEPLPPLTTTEVPTTTTTDKTTPSTNKTDVTTVTPLNVLTVPPRVKRETNKCKPVQDSICNDASIIAIDDCHTYGHYMQSIGVRAPISTVNITGMNWLQHGDLLNLQVKFTGSPPFYYCIEYKMGQYNITGNETCNSKTETNSTSFPLIHYFLEGEQHTVVVIIENVIGKNVSKATINIYKASIHAQLSVIVVPVSFCLLAVTLVIFGVAYYQHRSRFTVEVADFDFGQAHLEYKTFWELLRDSFKDAINFGHDDDMNTLTSNTRYDSVN